MHRVKVKFFSGIRYKTGTSATELKADHVGDLIEKLVEKYQELKEVLAKNGDNGWEIKSGITVMLNGRNVRFLEGMDTNLNEGDSVAIFPQVGGG